MVTSSVTQLSNVMTELSVEIPKDEVTKALDRAFAQLGRNAKIRGFRKGKVPRSVLKRMFGDAVEAEVRSDLVGTYLQLAMKEHEIVPLSEPEIEADPLKSGEDYGFKVKFETRHKQEAIDYDGIELEKQIVVTTEEQVGQNISQLRSSMADVIDLDEPRPAAEGDLAKVTMKSWVGGEWKDMQWPEQEIVLGEGRMEKEIEEALVGLGVGEEKVVDLGSESDLEEQRTRYLLTLNEIKERRLPELDDEFAKDVGDYESLDGLRESVAERLAAEGKATEDRRVQQKFFEALRERNKFDLPPSLLKAQATQFQLRVQSSLAMLGEGGGPTEEEREAMQARADKAAEEMVHQHLLVLECARIEGLEVGDEDVDKSIEEFATERGLPLPMVRAEYAKEGRREELAHSLLEKKIFDFASSKVTITEVEALTEKKEGEGD